MYTGIINEIVDTLPEFTETANKLRYTFCEGWSDMFYVPKRWFESYLKIANVFKNHNFPFDGAAPSILNFLLMHYPDTGVEFIDDCTGGCCASFGPETIRRTKCGHKLNLAVPEQVEAHFGRL